MYSKMHAQYTLVNLHVHEMITKLSKQEIFFYLLSWHENSNKKANK